MVDVKIGFVGFGEVNTPKSIIDKKCADALSVIRSVSSDVFATASVSDDKEYAECDRAIRELKTVDFDMLVVCIAGWIPTHAVIRVIDPFRHKPMLLWGLCGWVEEGRLVSTADQAGTSALRYTMEAFKYQYKFVYSSIGKKPPIPAIEAFARACKAKAALRGARIGSVGYRDMMLYGTTFDQILAKEKFGVEVEFLDLLEIEQMKASVGKDEIRQAISILRSRYDVPASVADASLEPFVGYAVASLKKIKERRYDAFSITDVDGMKRLLGLPPALVFMIIDASCTVCTIPENDIMGCLTQLMVRFTTGQIAAYGEFYEYFDKSFLIGVPDFIPLEVTKGSPTLYAAHFGLQSTSVVNVGKYKDGLVTLARLYALDGKYYMHLLTGEAKQPPVWEECGWSQPAPRLPSLEIFPNVAMSEFAAKVTSQHIILCYGDHTESLRDLCRLLGVEVV